MSKKVFMLVLAVTILASGLIGHLTTNHHILT